MTNGIVTTNDNTDIDIALKDLHTAMESIAMDTILDYPVVYTDTNSVTMLSDSMSMLDRIKDLKEHDYNETRAKAFYVSLLQFESNYGGDYSKKFTTYRAFVDKTARERALEVATEGIVDSVIEGIKKVLKLIWDAVKAVLNAIRKAAIKVISLLAKLIDKLTSLFLSDGEKKAEKAEDIVENTEETNNKEETNTAEETNATTDESVETPEAKKEKIFKDKLANEIFNIFSKDLSIYYVNYTADSDVANCSIVRLTLSHLFATASINLNYLGYVSSTVSTVNSQIKKSTIDTNAEKGNIGMYARNVLMALHGSYNALVGSNKSKLPIVQDDKLHIRLAKGGLQYDIGYSLQNLGNGLVFHRFKSLQEQPSKDKDAIVYDISMSDCSALQDEIKTNPVKYFKYIVKGMSLFVNEKQRNGKTVLDNLSLQMEEVNDKLSNKNIDKANDTLVYFYEKLLEASHKDESLVDTALSFYAFLENQKVFGNSIRYVSKDVYMTLLTLTKISSKLMKIGKKYKLEAK